MPEIRALSVDDVDAFIHIRQESIRAEPLAFGADPHKPIDKAQTLADLSRKNEENFILGYFSGDELVGLIGFIRNTSMKRRHRGDIWGMYVKGSYRGQGIASSLLSDCIRRAFMIQGLRKIALSVTSYAESALKLYKKTGFRPYGREEKALGWQGVYVDEIFMELLRPDLSD